MLPPTMTRLLWVDKLMLGLLPPFLAYVGAMVTGEGILRYVALTVGGFAGIAVVRGIESAINAHRKETEK